MANLKNVEKVAQDIKDITIQWATNIAREACKIMQQELLNQKFKDSKELLKEKINNILSDKKIYEEYKENAIKISNPLSGDIIYDEIKKIL